MAETEGTVEVLKEIRDEIRNVRTEVLAQIRNARTGVRTERFDRASRWRVAAMASTGAVALVALVIALRAGGQTAPRVVVAPPTVATATPAPAPTPSAQPQSSPAPAPVAAAVAVKPAAAKPAPHLLASVPAEPALPKKRPRPDAPVQAPAAAPGDGDEPIAFSPPPRRVRVHKMSYGPIESEPAKL